MKEEEEKRYEEFLNKFAANAQRLRRVGINSFGYDPGYQVDVEGCYGSISLPTKLVEIICDLVKKVYPETEDDEKMIEEYKKHLKDVFDKRNKK